KGPLMAAALLLMVLDTLAVLWMGGIFTRRPKRAAGTGASVAAVLLATALAVGGTDYARADDSKPNDIAAVDAVSVTRLAYVITGDAAVDSISRAGLTGLTRFLIEKTALEPGDPAGVDISKDELAFYPLLYWPIDPGAAMPS
ncbi:DUF4159 domain-containing protein, partial [Rhizobiaceae sp. 2RAB30]